MSFKYIQRVLYDFRINMLVGSSTLLLYSKYLIQINVKFACFKIHNRLLVVKYYFMLFKVFFFNVKCYYICVVLTLKQNWYTHPKHCHLTFLHVCFHRTIHLAVNSTASCLNRCCAFMCCLDGPDLGNSSSEFDVFLNLNLETAKTLQRLKTCYPANKCVFCLIYVIAHGLL